MSILSDEADRLREKYGGHWNDHPDHPFEDWQHEAANNATRLGYWEWVAAREESGMEDDDEEDEE